jgi:2-C-methyl-D-erythritol 2,4-cyclodiphosphate synthase
MELIVQHGYTVVNIDSTICLEEPKLKQHTPAMRKVIAEITGVAENDVSIKATTTEKMGFIGKGKGIMAYATVLLRKD